MSAILPITYLWMGRNWQFYCGGGSDTYGRFVLWIGPIYVSFGVSKA